MLLVIQPGAIGDFILSLPALRALRLGPGAGGMEIWAQRNNLPLVEHPGYADSVRPLAETGLDSYPLPERTLDAMRRFDLVVSWRGANFPELAAAVKAAHPRAHFLPQFPPEGGAVHLADFRREQLSELAGGDALARPPEIFLAAGDQEFADQVLGEMADARPLVMVHPGASSKRKRWPAGHFAALVRHALDQWRAHVLLTEGPLDREAVEEVVQASASASEARPIRIPNLRRLAAVLRRAGLFVGNDTGIAHLAAAAGAPTLAIFTGTDPRAWAPRGRRVGVLMNPQLQDVIEVANQRM